MALHGSLATEDGSLARHRCSGVFIIISMVIHEVTDGRTDGQEARYSEEILMLLQVGMGKLHFEKELGYSSSYV